MDFLLYISIEQLKTNKKAPDEYFSPTPGFRATDEKLMLGIGSIDAKMSLDGGSRQLVLLLESYIDLDNILELSSTLVCTQNLFVRFLILALILNWQPFQL